MQHSVFRLCLFSEFPFEDTNPNVKSAYPAV